MKIRPLHDRVIVKRMEEERTSPGGIVIPDAATEKPGKGEVTAVGNGKILENGDVRALDIKAGDKVLFGKYSGTEVKVDGAELLVMIDNLLYRLYDYEREIDTWRDEEEVGGVESVKGRAGETERRG